MTDHAPVRSGRQSPQWPIKASEITVRLAVVAAGALALGWLLLYLRVVLAAIGIIAGIGGATGRRLSS